MTTARSNLMKLGFGLLTAAAAGFGTLAMRGKGAPDKRWFKTLDKPSFQPPDWVFGPVWSVLYATVAYSGWRVYRAEKSPERTRALALWGAQLGLNAAWTPLFFGARKPGLALADIFALDTLATSYAIAARRVDPVAATAFVPYLGWIGFATALNTAIVAKNQ